MKALRLRRQVFAALAAALLIATVLLVLVKPAQGAVTLLPGFTKSRIISQGTLATPTDMEFSPNGRLFITEQAGRVLIVKPNGTLTRFLDISGRVAEGSNGLLGVTFDPNFATNHFVYLHYTRKATATTPAHSRVVRVIADGNKAVAGSEQLVFQLDNVDLTRHFGGAIDFGADGKLYIAVGENGTPDNAQTLANLKGKVLRINKDGTIPSDNPFFTTASGKNRAIWALGLRNPFKFAIQLGTGTIFINDVGEHSWEEINLGVSGANYGWPDCEGNHDNPNIPDSVNCSAAPYTAPVYEYMHGDTDTEGCAITGGAFYDPATGQFPSDYVGDYFFADLCNGWIRRYDVADDQAMGFATGLRRPVDLEIGEDGSLYTLNMGAGRNTGSVLKIEFTG